MAKLTVLLHPSAATDVTTTQAAGWEVGWLQSRTGWLLILDNVEDWP